MLLYIFKEMLIFGEQFFFIDINNNVKTESNWVYQNKRDS
jgi:hypothetical protein